MKRPFAAKRLRFAAIVMIAATGALGAQTGESAGRTDSITVSLTLDKNHFQIGDSPWVILMFHNQTDHDLYLHGNWFRLHIEGENGEPPTKLRQRMTTGKLLPGEAPLSGDENAEKIISAGKSRIEKIDVSYFYDLRVPGKYTVYVDIKDPLSEQWLRTSTEKFEISLQ